MKGRVYLVGAGPGDPDLLTVKALRLLRSAEAVLYDDLVSPEILSLIPATAQLHNVGKRSGAKKIQQAEINFLMIALAESGKQVVRLKSGDPLIFGRAGEEMEALRHAGIAYEVVPGITSALGAAAAAQIPLTHRRESSAVVLLAGHQAEESSPAEWNKLAASGSTLVIYMPGQNYDGLAARLKNAGLTVETPCAVISQATTSRETVHRTTIADLTRTPILASPTLLVVGEVVRQSHADLSQITASSATEPYVHSTLFKHPPSKAKEESFA
ncbi:MAG: uroporphyrinogen-III C-methyltransferase [Candidatus Sulfotelmatobacter sp.]